MHRLRMIAAGSCFLLASVPAMAADKAAPVPVQDGQVQGEQQLSAAWDHYYQAIEQGRRAIVASPQYAANPAQRAKAFQVLMEAQAMAYNFVIAPRTTTPRMFRNTGWQTEIYTLGGNGPDFDYRVAFLDGGRTYRITGNIRDSRMLLGQLMGSIPGTGGSRFTRNYDFSDFTVQKDGSFEIIASATRQPGNWIALDPASDFQWLLFRPTVDKWNSHPAELKIERIDAVTPAQYAQQETSAAAMAQRIERAAGFYTFLVEEWSIGYFNKTQKNAGGDNVFNFLSQEDPAKAGSPTANYVMSTFDLADDEALIVDLPRDPKGVYWSFELFDVWLRSLDFRTRQSTLNADQIRRDPDGRVRLVVASRDPGYANWLDTTGLLRGQLLFRDYRSNSPFSPVTRKVKFADLGRYLPATATRVTPAQRAADLASRAEGYRLRHGE